MGTSCDGFPNAGELHATEDIETGGRTAGGARESGRWNLRRGTPRVEKSSSKFGDVEVCSFLFLEVCFGICRLFSNKLRPRTRIGEKL